MLNNAIAPTALSGGGIFHVGFTISRHARNVAFVCLALAATAPCRLFAHDLIAVTESGNTFVIAEVEQDTKVLAITLRNSGISMEDPVVDITGIADLNELRRLSFFHVPQIASFDFLGVCGSVEKLVITFARVRSMRFLEAMPNLVLLYLEFCGDWMNGEWLPFMAEPLDLVVNKRLKYLAFRICDLERVPLLANVPDTLDILDISYNAIAVADVDTPALEALRDVERIYVNGNTVAEAVLNSNKNMVFENADGLLAEYLDE
jgi:hypothetical protein